MLIVIIYGLQFHPNLCHVCAKYEITLAMHLLIGHVTVGCLVAWLMNTDQAGGELALID